MLKYFFYNTTTIAKKGLICDFLGLFSKQKRTKNTITTYVSISQNKHILIFVRFSSWFFPFLKQTFFRTVLHLQKKQKIVQEGSYISPHPHTPHLHAVSHIINILNMIHLSTNNDTLLLTEIHTDFLNFLLMSSLLQNPIEDTLHLIVMSPQAPLGCDIFLNFPYF